MSDEQLKSTCNKYIFTAIGYLIFVGVVFTWICSFFLSPLYKSGSANKYCNCCECQKEAETKITESQFNEALEIIKQYKND